MYFTTLILMICVINMTCDASNSSVLIQYRSYTCLKYVFCQNRGEKLGQRSNKGQNMSLKSLTLHRSISVTVRSTIIFFFDSSYLIYFAKNQPWCPSLTSGKFVQRPKQKWPPLKCSNYLTTLSVLIFDINMACDLSNSMYFLPLRL